MLSWLVPLGVVAALVAAGAGLGSVLRLLRTSQRGRLGVDVRGLLSDHGPVVEDGVPGDDSQSWSGVWRGRSVSVAFAAESGSVVVSAALDQPWSGLTVSGGRGGVVTGDADFDAKVCLIGPGPEPLSRIDAHTRGALLELVDGLGGGLSEDQVRAIRPASSLEAGSVGHLLDGLDRVAGLLDGVDGAPQERLRRIALEDEDRDVRRRVAEALKELFPDAPETAQVLAALKRDPDGELRLAVLEWTGDTDGLVTLVRSPAMTGASRATALQRLRHSLSWDAVTPHVDLALGSDAPALVRAALEIATYRGRRIGDGTRAALRRVVARREPALLEAALVALGACGERQDLATLAAFSEHEDPDVRAVAQRARGELLQSQSPESAGSLAVVEPGDEGGLSVAEDDVPGGQLSLDTEG